MAQANSQQANDPFSRPDDLQDILTQAETDYDQSQQELNRPSTDVVLYSACFFARRALHHYLYYYYKKYNGPDADKSPHELTIEQMADYCKDFNKQIANIDFEHMHCRKSDVLEDEEVFFCNDVDKVGSCKGLAEQMRQVVYEKNR